MLAFSLHVEARYFGLTFRLVVMKVSKVFKNDKVSSKKKVGNSDHSAGFVDLLSGKDEATGADDVGAVLNAGDVASVADVDNVEEREARRNRQKAIKWGENLIDGLKDLRDSFLSSDLSEEQMHNLLKKLKQHSDHDPIDDEGLEDALNSVEIRAHVEAAKLRKVLKKKQEI